MSSQSKKENLDGKKLLLSAFLICSALGLVWLALNDDDSINENESISVQASDEAVRKHLHKTSQKIQQQKVQAQLDNLTQAPRWSEEGATQVYEASSHGIEFKSDPRLNELTQTLERNQKPANRVPDPKELIQAQLYERQKWDEYTLAYRQAYAQKFIENARKNGWDIRLNDDYKIVKIRPLKKDQRPQLFNGMNSERTPNSTDSSSPK